MITIGCDPEFFIQDEKTWVPAIGMVPGDKGEPYRVDEGAVQVDGLALEFNIDPANSFEVFEARVNKVVGQLMSMIPSKFSMVRDSVVPLTPEHLIRIPESALEIGCNPDVDPYTEDENPAPPQGWPIRAAVRGPRLCPCSPCACC